MCFEQLSKLVDKPGQCKEATIKFLLLFIIIIIIIIIITFVLIQEKGFTESLLNWKTSTGPNSAQLPFLYVITQTLETVNVDLELD